MSLSTSGASTTYSRIHLIGISGSDQDFLLESIVMTVLVCHNNGLSGERSQSLPEIPINRVLIS